MTKEELRKLISNTNDEKIREALWELYDMKYADSQKSIFPNTLFPNWYEKTTTTYSDRRD